MGEMTLNRMRPIGRNEGHAGRGKAEGEAPTPVDPPVRR
jgi:hypothetical protein